MLEKNYNVDKEKKRLLEKYVFLIKKNQENQRIPKENQRKSKIIKEKQRKSQKIKNN